MDLFGSPDIALPGAGLPAPSVAAQMAPAVSRDTALVDVLDDAVAHAIAHHDARAYMEALAKQKPDLFFKYVQLVLTAKAAAGPSKAAAILTPIGRSALDVPPQP